MSKHILLVSALMLLAACPHPPPPPPPARDMAVTTDLACIRCNAVINPCPALGIYCAPAIGCCSSTPNLGALP